MATSGTADLVGRVLDGRYRLLEPIGRGASGQVYAADDTQLQRRVAVKVLHLALSNDAGFLRRFQVEAQVAASLSHPNIMVVHDSGNDNGLPYMVMELLDGGSLRGMLDEGHLLSPSQAASLGRDVARALAYAHRRGIVHRDIKPANLLFDSHGVVKIADFGVARALAEASWTEPMGSMVGTARYASPEQALGVQLDGRSDIYSLALVLVEAVTGVLPFDAETPLSLLNVRTQEPIVVDPALGQLRAVLERCGQVQRDDRYPDAQTLVSALDDAVFALPPALPLQLVGSHGNDASDPTNVQRAAITALPVDRTPEPDPEAAPDVDTSWVASDTPPPVQPFDQDALTDTGEFDAAEFGAGTAGPPPVSRDEQRREAAFGPGRGGGWSQRLVPIAVALAVIAALAGSVAAIAGVGANPGHAVPSVIGLTKDAVKAKLAADDLSVQFSELQADDPAGNAIRQVPAPGTFVRDLDTVKVVLSKGPGTVEVPPLKGLSQTAAVDRLKSRGLIPAPSHAYDDTNPDSKGKVFKSPSSGKTVPKDTTIAFVVSDGHRPVTIPAIKNQPYEDAKRTLERLGFIVTRAKDDVYSDTTPLGAVVSSSPVIGTKRPYRSKVELTVSKGPDLVTMPTVVGLQAADACKLLRKNGLDCASPLQGPLVTGVVTAADKQPGDQVKRGTKIQLTVA